MTADLTLYPAIDLKDGACVRLLHGAMDSAQVYNKDPAAQAEAFEKQGFSWLHMVDLDGAIAGRSRNADAVAAILAATSAKTQLGGGIRAMGDIERWLDLGVSRVILGTVAVEQPALVAEAARAFPGRIVVGVDARDGRVRTAGWEADSGAAPLEIVKRFQDVGVAAVIFTDISRDGALSGVNVEATSELAAAVNMPVIASGGVAGINDISRLAAAKTIEGVVIGRALYDGRLTPADALNATRR